VRSTTSVYQQPKDPLQGQVLGDRYRLVSVLGEGGMGTVYLAEHVAIGKQLAVKVLASEFAQQDQYRKRFLREAQAISQIAHENIVEVTDFGVTPHGSLYLVMEYLQGEGLADTLQAEGALPWSRAKPMILQICRALHAAHAKGILHRDVKPENCFRIKRGSNRDFMKVLDFGLAKILGSQGGVETSLTGTGRVIGTAEYMSPEQIRGEKLDARSDVYSAGIVLYETMTGCVPYAADHYTLVLDQQLHAQPVPPRQVAPHGDISDDLERVILRALQKDRAHRYANIEEFATDLAQVVVSTSISVSSHPPAPPMIGPSTYPPPPRAKKSNESLYLGIIVGLSLLVLGLAGALIAFLLGAFG
jgi:serine/threonine-protein kinase